jgi:hypothetical protein
MQDKIKTCFNKNPHLRILFFFDKDGEYGEEIEEKIMANFNWMELSPKGTGKSHVFQELSPHGVLVSGGTDYLAELLHDLRKQDYAPVIQEYNKFDPSLTERDHTAIRKTFSGMMKLLYPDKKITHPELLELIDFAVEGRKRVKGQGISYELKDFHDRKITANTGWEIVLGRGLDIYEPRKGYSIEDYMPEKRRCKDFMVTYIPKETNYIVYKPL